MKIAIIVAMDKELRLLLPLLADKSERDINTYRIYEGRIGSNQVIIMKSGIGKVNASLASAALIDNLRPDLVINSGVAGGISSDTHPLDVVVGRSTAYHDVWCGPGTIPGQAHGCPLLFAAPSRILSMEALKETSEPSGRVLHGTIASGDIFISKCEEVKHIKSLFPGALAADMESAAIAQTCYLKGIDFIAIRVISDTPGSDDNITQYNDFWEKAPEQTFVILQHLLNELN